MLTNFGFLFHLPVKPVCVSFSMNRYCKECCLKFVHEEDIILLEEMASSLEEEAKEFKTKGIRRKLGQINFIIGKNP